MDRPIVLEVRDGDPDERQTSLLDYGRGRSEQAPGRRDDRVRLGRRPRQRVRARRAREVVEAKSEHDGAAGPSSRAHPARDPVDEPE